MFLLSVITLLYAGIKVIECIEEDKNCNPKVGTVAGIATSYIIRSILRI